LTSPALDHDPVQPPTSNPSPKSIPPPTPPTPSSPPDIALVDAASYMLVNFLALNLSESMPPLFLTPTLTFLTLTYLTFLKNIMNSRMFSVKPNPIYFLNTALMT
jgi:hypothetical protein